MFIFPFYYFHIELDRTKDAVINQIKEKTINKPIPFYLPWFILFSLGSKKIPQDKLFYGSFYKDIFSLKFIPYIGFNNAVRYNIMIVKVGESMGKANLSIFLRPKLPLLLFIIMATLFIYFSLLNITPGLFSIHELLYVIIMFILLTLYCSLILFLHYTYEKIKRIMFTLFKGDNL